MRNPEKLRSELVVASSVVDNATVYNIKDPSSGTYFRLREPDYWLAQQFDGRTSCEEIARQFKVKFGLAMSAEEVSGFVDGLDRLGFLDNSRAEQSSSRSALQSSRGGSLFARLLFIKVKAFRPGASLEFLTRIYGRFHSLGWFGVSLMVIALGVAILFQNASTFAVNIYDVFQLSSLLVIIFSLFVLFGLHELAHAVVCRYHGGEVREMGVLLLYFQPCFYTDLSDAWLFEKKSHRLAVTAAGPYFQLILLALAAIVWRLTVEGVIVNEVARIVVVAGWIMLLLNLNPLIKLDGYYLLSDAVDIPNLRKKSFAYLSRVIEKYLLGWPVEATEANRRQKRIMFAYAVLAVMYSALLIAYLLWIAYAFFREQWGTTGILLLTVVLLFTLRSALRGLARGAIKYVRLMKTILKKPVRLIVHLTIAAGTIVLVFAVSFPHRVSGEVSVQPVQEFSLLLNDFGYLEKRWRRGGAHPETSNSFLRMTSTDLAALDLNTLVQDGQRVQPGDTVAILKSNQVINEIAACRSVMTQLESKLALLKSPPKKEEVREVQSQVAGAQAAYDRLMKEKERFVQLSDRQLTTSSELDSVSAAVAVAEAELNNRKATLELLKSPPKPEEENILESEIEQQNSKLDFLLAQQEAQLIISPIEGVVSLVPRSEDLVLSVFDNHDVEVLVPVSDFDIGLLKDGQPVTLKLRSYPSRSFEGTIVHIPREAVRVDGQSYYLVSVVIGNGDDLLSSGMSGFAKIHVGSKSLFGLAKRRVLSFIRVEFWSWW